MEVNINEKNGVASCILKLVNNLKFQYGKATLSKILNGSESINIKYKNIDKNPYYGCLNAFTQEQVKNIRAVCS